MTVNSDVDIPTTIMHLNLRCEGMNLSNSSPPHYILRWDTNSELSPKPTDEELNAGWESYKTAQAAIKYQKDRASQYPSLQEQLDLQYWDQVNGTTKWKEAIAKVKADNPKP